MQVHQVQAQQGEWHNRRMNASKHAGGRRCDGLEETQNPLIAPPKKQSKGWTRIWGLRDKVLSCNRVMLHIVIFAEAKEPNLLFTNGSCNYCCSHINLWGVW